MIRHIGPFAAGLLFAAGLGLSGMTDPHKVLGFLDVTGVWNPALAWVMGGALAVHALALRFIFRRGRPLADANFHVGIRRSLDAPLVAGAALFGIGWGIGGFCPGPALVSVVTAHPMALTFAASMAAGSIGYRVFARRVFAAAAPVDDPAPFVPAETCE